MKDVKGAIVACALLLVGLITIVGPGSPASAAVGCTESGCAGAMASSMGCVGDAISVTGFGTAGKVEYTLFYSPSCLAGWAEGVSLDGGPLKFGAAPLALQVWHQAAYGGLESSTNDTVDAGSTATTIDTPMVNWDESLKLCANFTGDAITDPVADPNGGSNTNSTAQCTSWR